MVECITNFAFVHCKILWGGGAHFSSKRLKLGFDEKFNFEQFISGSVLLMNILFQYKEIDFVTNIIFQKLSNFNISHFNQLCLNTFHSNDRFCVSQVPCFFFG